MTMLSNEQERQRLEKLERLMDKYKEREVHNRLQYNKKRNEYFALLSVIERRGLIAKSKQSQTSGQVNGEENK